MADLLVMSNIDTALDSVINATEDSVPGPAAADVVPEATVPVDDGSPVEDVPVKSYPPRSGGRSGRRNTPHGRGGRSGHRAPLNLSPEEDENRSRRVYVGNLSWEATWQDLKDHMRGLGDGCEVRRADVLQGHDGRSKGCGLVEFETAEGARRAVLMMNDTELMGRQIFVREDREAAGSSGPTTQEASAPPSSMGLDPLISAPNPAGGTAPGIAGRRCYVGNLAWEVAWQDLKDHMRGAGEVLFAEVMTTGDGRSKGCGIVEFATSEQAQEAIATLNDSDLMGRMIFVREDREQGGGGSGGFRAGARSGGGYVANTPPVSGAGGIRVPPLGNTTPSTGASAPDAVDSTRGRRVYVGNLSWEVAWQDLKDHMRGAGEVLFSEVMTSGDGRSKGCGIVEFATAEQAQEAIAQLNDTDLMGRMIFVREDREVSGGGGGGTRRRGGGGSGAGGVGQACSVYVGNLAFETSWQDLKDHMRAAGNVDKADILQADDGRSKGCAVVTFQKAQEAQRAIRELQNTVLHERPIFVREDREQPRRSRR